MNNTATINHLLQQLGARIGANNVHLSDQGICSFQFENEMRVVIELPDSSPDVYLYATLLPIPERNREALYAWLLKRNLLGYDTDGATFAIHEQHNAIVLCYQHAIETLDYVLFESILENFLTTVARWHRNLRSFVFDNQPESERPADIFDPLAHFNKLV
jgi:hypothetical protein